MKSRPPQLSFPHPHIARIDFRRPKEANRLEAADLRLLQSYLPACDANEDLHVLLITSCGTTFSSGFDLRTLKQQAASARTDEVAVLESFIDRLAASRLITIAALNGLAIGAASDLVLACDLRLATVTAGIRMPAARFGMPLYLGALRRYLLAFGPARAKHLILTGKPAYSEELQRLGIVSEIVPPERLESRALELAKFISSMPPLPLQAMKQAIDGLAHGAFDDGKMSIALEQAFDGQQIVKLIEAMRPSE